MLNEPGAPSWFELHARDHAAAVAFYRSVFRWDTNVVGDTDEFRYTVMRDPSGEGELAGIMDAASFLPEGEPAHWSIYWGVDDVHASVAKVKARGARSCRTPRTPRTGAWPPSEIRLAPSSNCTRRTSRRTPERGGGGPTPSPTRPWRSCSGSSSYRSPPWPGGGAWQVYRSLHMDCLPEPC